MKPIWYFVGLILFIMGVIIFFTGIYTLYYPEANQKILSSTHPDIWWGAIMTVVGFIYIIMNRKIKI
ncbi:MAG: hypothetical protein ACYCVH_00095 [Ignavibacteriaceae bacterium]